MGLKSLKKSSQEIDRAIQWAGGQAKLARILGVTRAAVNGWKREGKMPERRALHIEGLSFGLIRAADLIGADRMRSGASDDG